MCVLQSVLDGAGVPHAGSPPPFHLNVGPPHQLARPDKACLAGLLHVCQHAGMGVLQVALVCVEDDGCASVVLVLHL